VIVLLEVGLFFVEEQIVPIGEPGHFEGVHKDAEEAVHPGLLRPGVFLKFPLQDYDDAANQVHHVYSELDLDPQLGVETQPRVIVQVVPLGVLCDDDDCPQQEHDGQLEQEPDELAAHLALLLLRSNAVVLVVVELVESLAMRLALGSTS